MSDFITLLIGYVVSFFVGIIALSFFQRGFLIPFMRVKLSQGKLILVKIRGISKDYFRAGRITETELRYKDEAKHTRLINIPEIKEEQTIEEKAKNLNERRRVLNCIYRTIGVSCIDVDDETNAIMSRDYSAVTGFDAERMENLNVRALMKPTIMDDKTKLMIILLVVIIGLTILGLFIDYQLGQRLGKLMVTAGKSVVQTPA
jgi:hypothetical protein